MLFDTLVKTTALAQILSVAACVDGGADGSISILSADGSSLVASSYFSGTGDDRPSDVDASSADILGIAGAAGSSPFPTVNTNDSSTNGEYGAVHGCLVPN